MKTATNRLLELFNRVQRSDPERLLPIFARHGVDAEQGAKALVNEIGLDGANTFAALARGWKGVGYEVVVRDVASQLGAKCEDGADERTLERAALEQLLARAISEDEDLRSSLQQAIDEQRGGDFDALRAHLAVPAATGAGLALLINQVGAQAVAAVVKRVVLVTVGKRAAKEAAKRALAITGFALPLINVGFAAWTAVDLAGPALRKTVPTVLDVALLRLEYPDAADGDR